jgi:hypothetical protein
MDTKETSLSQQNPEAQFKFLTKKLGLRASAVARKDKAKEVVISLLEHGDARMDDDGELYVRLDTPFNGTSEVKIEAKKYTVNDIQALGGRKADGNESVIGAICTPCLTVAYLQQESQVYVDLNAIALFLFPS